MSSGGPVFRPALYLTQYDRSEYLQHAQHRGVGAVAEHTRAWATAFAQSRAEREGGDTGTSDEWSGEWARATCWGVERECGEGHGGLGGVGLG